MLLKTNIFPQYFHFQAKATLLGHFSFLITCILKKEPRQGGKDSWAGEEAAVVVVVPTTPALDTDGTMAPVIALTIPAQNMVEIMDPEILFIVVHVFIMHRANW